MPSSTRCFGGVQQVMCCGNRRVGATPCAKQRGEEWRWGQWGPGTLLMEEGGSRQCMAHGRRRREGPADDKRAGAAEAVPGR
jgi:hypothetical protein